MRLRKLREERKEKKGVVFMINKSTLFLIC